MYVLYTVYGVFSKVHCVLGRNTSLNFIELIERFSNHSKIESEKKQKEIWEILSILKWMKMDCGSDEDAWEFLEQQGDQISHPIWNQNI